MNDHVPVQESFKNDLQEVRIIQHELHAKLDLLNKKIEELARSGSVALQKPDAMLEEPSLSLKNKTNIVKKSQSFELNFGSFWLVRIGVILLLTGLVFLGNFAWNEFIIKFGPLEKLLLIYLSGFLLGGIGWALYRRNKIFKGYGLVLVGAGMATTYYATYAAYFVNSLRVIQNPFLAGSCLVVLSILIVVLAGVINSKALASIVIILGFYTAAMNPLNSFSLFSNILLSITAIVFLLRKRWGRLSLISLTGCYASFTLWRFHTAEWSFIVAFNNPTIFWTAFLFPLSYWIIFTGAAFLMCLKKTSRPLAMALVLINNAIFYSLTALLVWGTYYDQFWVFSFGYGVLLLGLGIIVYRLLPEAQALEASYLGQGLLFLFLGLILKLSKDQLAFIFALQSLFLMRASLYRHKIIFQLFSGLSALVACMSAWDIFSQHEIHSGIIMISVAGCLVATAWLLQFQEKILNKPLFEWRSAGYLFLANALGVETIYGTMTGDNVLYCFWGASMLLLIAFWLLRMAEILFLAEVIAAFGLWQWEVLNSQSIPLLPFLTIIALFLTILAAGQAGKRFLKDSPYFSSLLQIGLVVIGIVRLWMLVHQYVFPIYNGEFVTAAWALLSLLLLAGGFLSKERICRISGLLILLASITRLFLVDLWQLETIYRIFSFILLGIIMLLLSFLYNRFSETIKKWV